MARARTDQERQADKRARDRAATLGASAAKTRATPVDIARIGKRLMGIVVSNDTQVNDRIAAARVLLQHADVWEKKDGQEAPHFAVIPDRVVPPEIMALFKKDRGEWTAKRSKHRWRRGRRRLTMKRQHRVTALSGGGMHGKRVDSGGSDRGASRSA